MKGLSLAPVPVGTVRIETRRIPASVGENLAQTALRAIQRDFTNPDIQADYQRWKAERSAKRKKEITKSAKNRSGPTSPPKRW